MFGPPEPASPSSPPSFLVRARRRCGRSGIVLLAAIALITGLCIDRVLDGPKPWGKEVTKRVLEGKDLRAKEHGIIGVWWGCAIGAGIGGLLLLSAPFWLPGGPNTPRRSGKRGTVSPGTAFHLALFLVLGGTVWLRVPQLQHSLWNDEEYALRRYFHGESEPRPGGGLSFEPVSWDETLFHNFNGNNHLLQSALARLSLESWRFLTGAEPEAWEEWVVRLPSIIAGVFTLILLAMLGVEIGSAAVGFGAAALLALHPWHVRYAAEARGYSLMLLFITMAVLALLHALRRDKASSWLCFAVAEAGFLLSFAGSLYVAIMLNFLAAWELLRRREPRRLATLAAFNVLGAIPVLIWMLPSVPQLIDFLAREKVLQTPIGLAWARDVGSHLASGLLYSNPEPALHVGTSWQNEAANQLLWRPLLLYAMPVLAITGLFGALLRAGASRLAIVGVFGGGLLAVGQNLVTGQSMLSWYLLYLLLPLCLAVPLGVRTLIPWNDKTAAPAILLVVALFAMTTEAARARFIAQDRQPIRHAAASYREPHPEALAVVCGVSDRQFQSYDPRARVIETLVELQQAVAQARTERRPLFVVLCGRSVSLKRNPELVRAMLDGPDFEIFSEHPGLEAMFSYEVFRLLPVRKPMAP